MATKPPVLILVGGFTTPLRALEPENARAMTKVRGRPFLDWTVEHLIQRGYKEIHLVSGFRAPIVDSFPWSETYPDAEITVARSTNGTGGAVKEFFESYPDTVGAWVIYGEEFLPGALPDVRPILKSLDGVNGALLAIANEVSSRSPAFGAEISAGLLQSNSLVGTGPVFVTRSAVESYSGAMPCKLTDVLKSATDQKQVQVAKISGERYDISTPARLAQFEQYLDELHEEESA